MTSEPSEMTPQPDYTHWLTKQQVAQILAVSEKTVEKLAKDGKIEQRERKRAGKPPQSVFNPDDAERVRQEREPQPSAFVMPAGVAAPSPQSIEKAAPPAEMMQLLVESLRPHQERVRLAEKLYLTIREASEYSGFTQAHLLRLVDASELKVVRDVSLKVKRADLEKL